MYNNTSNIIICDHPLIKHKLSVIRDQETGTSEFRTIMQELAMLIGYEAMRDLPLNDVEIRTPAEIAKVALIVTFSYHLELVHEKINKPKTLPIIGRVFYF